MHWLASLAACSVLISFVFNIQSYWFRRPLMHREREKRPLLCREMCPHHWTPFPQICFSYRLCTAGWLSGWGAFYKSELSHPLPSLCWRKWIRGTRPLGKVATRRLRVSGRWVPLAAWMPNAHTDLLYMHISWQKCYEILLWHDQWSGNCAHSPSNASFGC